MPLIALRFNYIFIIINCYRYYLNNISHSIDDSINASFKDSLSCLPTKILTLILFYFILFVDISSLRYRYRKIWVNRIDSKKNIDTFLSISRYYRDPALKYLIEI